MTLFKELTPAIHDHEKKMLELIREEIKRIEDTHDVMPLVKMFTVISEAYYKGKGELILVRSKVETWLWCDTVKPVYQCTLETGLRRAFERTGCRNFRIEENEVYLLKDN